MRRERSGRTLWPRPVWSCVAAGLLVGATLAGADPKSAAPAPGGSGTDTAGVASGPGAGGGLRVYQDPDTGEFIEPPPGAESAEPPSSSFSTSGAGLTEAASPVSGGGVMVEVGDRFMNGMTATVGSDGKTSVTCGQTDHQHAVQPK